ncbi:hypothetical protein [Sandaracinus amylolyticus]|uniref:hypothetical protein n=1 Tax=Sandaracinus amylolyticus TaxID=927083 RepID=UPI001F48885E|nr:hypothetical protein [Sandaracinus amylolyticus]UJR81224.1 Hypothetical protein I5071_32800 [Sandaracinus amylolyticus]
MRSFTTVIAVLALCAGCNERSGIDVDAGGRVDARIAIDASASDAGAIDIDAGVIDVDASTVGVDANVIDVDASTSDDAGSESDASPGDDAGEELDAGSMADAGSSIDAGPTPPPGLSVPCSNGPGWTVFRLHFDGSSSPRIDVWDASCSYSLAPGSACEARVVAFGTGTVEPVMSGYAVALGTSSPYLRVRYSVDGLSFTRATLWVQARSYATSSSTNIRAWSPLHGETTRGPVDNDWTYDWYDVDWTDYLTPSDQPSLTAIQIYAHSGSGSLAVHAAELCVQ